MALYPLCRHQDQPQEAIAHAAGAIEHRVASAPERADALSVLGIFSALAYPSLDPVSIIGRSKMEDSLFAQTFRREGEKKNARAYILDSLKARFGPKSVAGLAKPLNALEDLEELGRLHRLSVTCKGIDEFRAALLVART